MTRPEFQAIVLAAGRGTRFLELTGDRPKCLLPIGPFPMIFYPLQMLHKHGFQEITVIVLESQRTEIQQAIERTPLKAKLDFASIPTDSDYGTVDALRHIQDRIKYDLVIVSCDTLTNISLFPLLNYYRKNNASIVAQLFKGGMEADAIIPGPKTKHKQDRDLIGVQPNTQRLTFLASTSDFEDTLHLPYNLLHRFGSIVMNSRLVDSHIYVMSKWIVDFLSLNNTFSTIKGELIPYIVKKQMLRPPAHNSDCEKPLSVVHVNIKFDDIFHFISQSDLQRKITETSLYNESDNRNPFNDDLIRCYALNPPENSFGIRVNTTPSYCAANQKIFELWGKLFPTAAPALVSPHSNIKSTQMSSCAVADHTTVSEKTSLKNCILGTNCMINIKTRISNSVLMNGVVVEDGVVIENCVICDKATIRTNCVLKNCLIGPNYEVAEGTIKEMAHLTNSDGISWKYEYD